MRRATQPLATNATPANRTATPRQQGKDPQTRLAVMKIGAGEDEAFPQQRCSRIGAKSLVNSGASRNGPLRAYLSERLVSGVQETLLILLIRRA
jgi:hypothetical protein